MKIKDSKRIIVGWGRKDNRLCFFITHKDIKGTIIDPIPCKPEELFKKIIAVANFVDSKKVLLKGSVKNE